MTLFYYGLSTLLSAACASGPLFLSISGQSLNGKAISRKDLLGKPTIVILTPSREDRKESSLWVADIRERFGSSVRVRDIVLIDAPFFMSEESMLTQARKVVPKKYWEETWLVPNVRNSAQLGSSEAPEKIYVYVLDGDGDVILRISGKPSNDKFEKIKNTLNAATAATVGAAPEPYRPPSA